MTTLLTYAATSNPNPIQASSSSGTSTASLTIAVSNSTSSVISCQGISFSFLVGENAKDLTNDASDIGTTPPVGWNLTNQGGGSFHATPKTINDGQIGATGLAFTLTGIDVNNQPGTFILTITEATSAQTGVLDLQMGKFPQQFVISELTANPLQIAPNASTTLSWSGSEGATYVIEYNGNTITHTKDVPPQPLPAVGSYEIDGLAADTLFNLVVTLQVPGQDQPLTAQQARQVTVLRAQITQFTVSPLTLGMGASGTVNWETNADTCTLDPGAQSVAAPNGSTTMIFNQSCDLTLTAKKGSDITQETRSITVVPPVIHSFTASTIGPVDTGTAVTLAWGTQFAASITLDPGVGTVAPTASQVVNPANTTTYTLTCTGLGPNVTQSVTVAVNPVQILSFGVQPGTINPGDSATLSWTSNRATSASIDNSVGTVTAASGSATVTPNPQHDTTYTLTCQGPDGPIQASTTLSVNSVRITSFDMSGGSGNAVTMTWTTENATAVTISKINYDSPQNLPVALNGSFNEYVDMSNPTTFVLSASGAGASPVTASVTGSGGW